jgi:hypothetical protein
MTHNRWQALMTLSCAAFALFPKSALAQTTTAVYSGGAIEWSGTTTNVNQFTGEDGNVLVDTGGVSNIVGLTGASWITKTVGTSTANAVFCTDVPNKKQAANTAYYIYYGILGTGYIHVISTTPPYAEGYPDKTLTYTSGTTTTTNTKEAVFLGSYVTDTSGNMVPFRRIGDSVYFLWGGGWSVILAPQQTYTWAHNATLTWPQTLILNIGTNYAFPATASTAIVGIFSKTSNGTATHSVVGVLDPQLPTISATTWYPLYSWQPPNVAAVVSAWDRVRVPTDGTGKVSVADLADPPVGTSDTVEIAYEGYVETIHHLY